MVTIKKIGINILIALNLIGSSATSATVSLKAPEVPSLNLSKIKMSLSVFQGEAIPEQTFVVKNLGRGTLHFVINNDQQWLSTSVARGTSKEGQSVTVSVNISKDLAAGNYQGRITVTGDKGVVTQSIPVFVSVKPKMAKN